jgi:hypothetical protein
MRASQNLRKQVNAALRDVLPYEHHFELVERYALCDHADHTAVRMTYNMLAFGACESDLWGSVPVSKVRDLGEPVDGRVVIDVYAYRSLGFGQGTELHETATVVVEPDGRAWATKRSHYDVVADYAKEAV